MDPALNTSEAKMSEHRFMEMTVIVRCSDYLLAGFLMGVLGPDSTP